MKVIIIGGGQVGSYIASLLLEKGNAVTVLENKEKALRALEQNGVPAENVLVGDGTDALLLEKPACAAPTRWSVPPAPMRPTSPRR